ncbi:integrase, catalytic region, zinc finger, CCHC-type containing protein, partial [Tanacetum coccineum]
TQQDIYATGSENRPPMLNKENYVSWSSRLLRYAKSRPNGKLFYNSIMNGPYVRRMIAEPGVPARIVPVPETFHEQTDDELTEAEIKQMEADDQAIQTILLGLPEDIYAAVDGCETAQEIWFSSTDGESIESYYHRFSILINDFKRNKHFPEKIASNHKFLNNLQPEWSRHVTIVHQTKDLHTADYTQLYDFLKYNQKEVDELRDERLAKSQDPLALMANSNNSFKYPVFRPNLPSSSTYIQQPLPNNNNYHPQPSFNQNYIQQPMPNLEDITDPTDIAQPVQNPGVQNGVIVVSGVTHQNGNGNVVAARAEGNANGNNGNQKRCYNCIGLGHLARNCIVRRRRRDAAYLQTQLLIAQKEEARIQLQAKEFDLMAAAANLDEIDEVNANSILMANLQQASTSEEQYTELLEPIPEPHQVPQNDSNAIYEVSSVEQGGGTVEQHSANVKETHAYHESLFHNLAAKVKKVNSVNRKMKEKNAELTTELSRYKNQERCFEISQEKYEKLERCYQQCWEIDCNRLNTGSKTVSTGRVAVLELVLASQILYQGPISGIRANRGTLNKKNNKITNKHSPIILYKMSQPANDGFSQHLTDDEESNHEDPSNHGAAPKQQQQENPQTTAYLKYQLPNLKKEEISTGKDGIVRILSPVTAAEIQAVEKERKAKNILLMAIPKEHIRRFHGMDDAKEIWEAIRTRFGAGRKKKNPIGLLTMDDGDSSIGETTEFEETNPCTMATAQSRRRIGKKAVKENGTLAENSRFMERFLHKNLWRLNDSGMIFQIVKLDKDLKNTIKQIGVPRPLSGDYTPKPQEKIDDSLYVYGKKGPQKQKYRSHDDKFSEHSAFNQKTVKDHVETTSSPSFKTESESLSVPNEMSKSSLSHLIKDCDYYEKKMAREAKVKRVVNTGNGVAKPVWTNANRINHSNKFVPRSVQLNAWNITGKNMVDRGIFDSGCSWHRFSWVFFLASKDETSGIIQTFIRQIENQLSHRVKIIRSDNDTEFKNRDMLEFCGNKGIKQEYSNARWLR